MPITAQQARAELARRELERRSQVEQPQGELSTPQTFQQNQLDRTISQRPDIYEQAVQATQQAKPTWNPIKAIGQATDIGLKSLGGVAQRGEAAIANPFLMNEGKFQNPFTAIKQGITGERLGELGDVARQAGVPEPIAATLGLIGTAGIGGALSKAAGLSSKVNNLTKLETTYGKDVAKNIIRHTTELPMPLVERGMKRGWRKILTKGNAIELDLPTRISSSVVNSLDDIAQGEYDEFGKVLKRVKTGSVKALDLNQVVEDNLKLGGYLDEGYNPTLKTRGPVVNEVTDFIASARKNNIKPTDNISVDVIQALKEKLRSFVPEKNWVGKNRSLSSEQRLAKEISNKLDDLVAYNSFGIEDEAYIQAKKRYSEFKNFEKVILDNFSEVVGQEVKPTADKIVGLSKIHPTKMIEEMNKLYYLDDFLNSKGHSKVADRLLDWMTTQEMLVKPEGGIFREFIKTPIKYGVRQSLQSGVPSAIGGRAGGVGQTTIPPSILRMTTGRNNQGE